MTAKHGRGREGFSLVEVNLALLVVGIGLISLLGLFPIGLRQGNMAISDTAQAAFADLALSRLHANALTITNWTRWSSDDNFTADMLKDTGLEVGGEKKLSNYLVPDGTIRYRLQIANCRGTDPTLKYAWIQVSDRSQGSLTNNPIYYTEFLFRGM